MRQSAFLPQIGLPDIGRGAGFAVWGFRACAMGGAGCCTVVRGFESLLEDDGAPTLGALLALARIIGHDGARKVSLAMPGCVRITRDEASLLNALSFAQYRDEAMRDANLAWLLARAPCEHASGLVDRVAAAFLARGYEIEAPEIRPVTPNPRPGSLYAIEGGRA